MFTIGKRSFMLPAVFLFCALSLSAETPCVIPAKFTYAGNFSEGLACATTDYGKYGYIDTKGEWVIQPRFMEARDFHDGLAVVKEPMGDWGYIGKDGAYVLKPTFKEANDFSEGLALVLIDNSVGQKAYGYIDKSGKMVIPLSKDGKLTHSWGSTFSDGFAAVNSGGKVSLYGAPTGGVFSIINKKGLVPFKFVKMYSKVLGFSDGMCVVGDGNLRGAIDLSGKEVIKPAYTAFYNYSEGVAIVISETADTMKYLIIDKKGKTVLELPSGIQPGYQVREGLFPAMKDEKWGFMNLKGEFVIEPQFSGAADFSEGYAAVNTGDADVFSGTPAWGYIEHPLKK
ncbi:MAG TPA: WG repeat-containing protein [Spirochaetia bacterium]|nr:WG repeat-containing protein [Spirochaetia bacterium]